MISLLQEKFTLISVIDYVSAMADEFSIKFGPNDIRMTPAAVDLFSAGTSGKVDKQQSVLHFCW